MQTQLPMKGLQQQTPKEESMKMMQTECEARRRMSRTKQSSEKPQLLQQVKRKHQQPPTQKHIKGLQQTCNGEEKVMQTMQEDEEEKAKNSSSIPWSQFQQEQQMKRKRFQRNHDTTRMNNDVKKMKK